MTPQEWKFIEQVIELACRHAYETGYSDGGAKLPSKPEQFVLKRGDKMTLQTELKKYVQKR